MDEHPIIAPEHAHKINLYLERIEAKHEVDIHPLGQKTI